MAVEGSQRTQFKPGQSGNMGGRPKYSGLSRELRRILESVEKKDKQGRTGEQLVAQRVYQDAIAGKAYAVQIIFERTEGPIVKDIETTDADLYLEAAKILVERQAERAAQKASQASDQ